MIIKLRQTYLKVFLGISILVSMGSSFASGDSKIEDIHTSAKVNGHPSQATTENLTQNQGGCGGDNHFVINAAPLLPHIEREKKPDEYYMQGEACINKKPPNWEEALKLFMYAANAEPPHALACVRCAEYYHAKTPPQIEQALRYYQCALSTSGIKPQEAYRGLMKLHHEVGTSSGRKKNQAAYLQKAKEYGGQINLQTPDDESFLDDIDQRLSQLGIIPIPEIARGYEEIYQLFYNGKLIYKPDPNSDAGKIEMPIAALANPLEGMFDLSRCGDTWKYLSIHTGYKKGKIAANKDKVEIWFVPRFMVERELGSTAVHLQPIMDKWSASIGIIWSWWNDDLRFYNYLTTQSPEKLSDNNLNEKWCHESVRGVGCGGYPWWGGGGVEPGASMAGVAGKIVAPVPRAEWVARSGAAARFFIHFVNKDERK